MHWNVKCDFFLRALLYLLPWVIFYVIYSAEHQCERITQCSVRKYIKAINSTVLSVLREPLFDHFAFWFLKKLIPKGILQLECLRVRASACCRSCCCRAVSCSWQWWELGEQAQGATATQAGRSPVATSEFHTKLCGNVCWFAKDLKFISFLWPCDHALPTGDNMLLSSEQL